MNYWYKLNAYSAK